MPCCKDDIIYIHPDSKFALELTFTSPSGEVINPGTHTFKYEYLDEDKRNAYPVSHNAETGEFVNCFIKDNRLYAKFEGFKFREGLLLKKVEVKEVIVPDEGEGLTDNTEVIYTICKTNFFISSQAGCCEPGCVAGYDNFVYPCVESGITQSQAQQEINEYINNKKLIADAITLKGVESSPDDTAKQLSEKILNIPNVNIEFGENIYINPMWHDILKVAADNYRQEIPHMWIMLISKSVSSVLLNGASAYLCSDGFYTTQSQEHVFNNVDDNKDTQWVIFYGLNASYVFREDLVRNVFAILFYNIDPSFVSIANLYISTSLLFLDIEDLLISTASWGRNNYFSNIYLHNVRNINISAASCFETLLVLNSVPVPEGVENIVLGRRCFAASAIRRFCTPKTLKSLTLDQTFNSSQIQEFIIQDASEATLAVAGANEFTGSKLKRCVFGKIKALLVNSSAFSSLNTLEELHIESPIETLTFTFAAAITPKILSLGNEWDYSINLTNAVNQTVDSMYQNVLALSDRTGQPALTLTYGTTKRNALLAAYPDAAQIATSKNWNLA